MEEKNTELFKKISEQFIPQITKIKDGKEYRITESRVVINPLKEQGYHSVYRILNTEGSEEIYEKVKMGILGSIDSKIGEPFRKFHDGIGEISVSKLELVDCPFNSGGISHMMRFSTEGGEASGIILLNCYKYPDDILIEMSIWTVDYSEEEKGTEIIPEKNDITIEHIDPQEKITKRQINAIDWFWGIYEKTKNWVLQSSTIIKVLLLVVFLATVIPFAVFYIILAIFFGLIYHFQNSTKNDVVRQDPQTRMVVVFDWSGIQALTQIRHMNFIKQKMEEAISEYLKKEKFNWDQGVVANYKPELLKEGMAKTIHQNVNNSFNMDFSKKIEVGSNMTGGTFQIGSIQ